MLTLAPRTINVPQALAFDGAGNLWVTCNGFLEEFTPDQLTASGTPDPVVTIIDQFSSAYLGSTVAFGRGGGLWVIGLDGEVLKFGPGQLGISGEPAPAVTLMIPNASGLALDNAGDLWVTNPLGAVTEYTPSQLAASGTPTPAVRIAGSPLNGAYQLTFAP